MTWYALATLRRGNDERTALVLGDAFYDLEQAAAVLDLQADWSRASVDELLSRWQDIAGDLDRFASAAADSLGRLEPVSPGAGEIAPPLRPGRFFCAAANYAEHADEMGTDLGAKSERKPYLFMKPDTALIGHDDAVILPPNASQVDWEIELAVVIGRRARGVSVDNALDYVAGYTIVNDVTARDLNVRDDYPFGMDWLQGKCFDTFAPLGPWLVPARCIENPQDLRMRLSVNESVMQDSTTAAMIFDIPEQLAYLSSIMTLKPGDVLATGTPTGVGMGRGIFLQPGDVMTATIESIGTLRNPVASA